MVDITGTSVSLTSPTQHPLEHEAPVDRTHHPSIFASNCTLPLQKRTVPCKQVHGQRITCECIIEYIEYIFAPDTCAQDSSDIETDEREDESRCNSIQKDIPVTQV